MSVCLCQPLRCAQPLATLCINTVHAPLFCTSFFRSTIVILVSFFIVSSHWVVGWPLLLFLLITASMMDLSESACMTWPKHDILCLAILLRVMLYFWVRFSLGLPCLWFLQSMGYIIVISSTIIQRHQPFSSLSAFFRVQVLQPEKLLSCLICI